MYSAYRMKRCTNHCGRFIRYGAWYPDRKVRLFDKRVAHWGGLNPHDKIILGKKIAVKQLAGEILHYSFDTLEEHHLQNERFSSIVALSYFKSGKTTNWLRLLVNPAWAFIYGFLLRRGFMNGRQGFAIAINQARYTWLKHVKLHRLQTGKISPHGLNVQTSANADRLSRDIPAHIGSKEQRHIRNVFRRRKTA